MSESSKRCFGSMLLLFPLFSSAAAQDCSYLIDRYNELNSQFASLFNSTDFSNIEAMCSAAAVETHHQMSDLTRQKADVARQLESAACPHTGGNSAADLLSHIAETDALVESMQEQCRQLEEILNSANPVDDPADAERAQEDTTEGQDEDAQDDEDDGQPAQVANDDPPPTNTPSETKFWRDVVDLSQCIYPYAGQCILDEMDRVVDDHFKKTEDENPF